MNDLNDPDREWQLLGAMVSEPSVIPSVIAEVESGDFDQTGSRRVFDALVLVYLRGATPDAFLVRDELADPALALKLVDAMRESTVVPANAAFHARRLRGLSMLRMIRSLSGEFADIDPTDDPSEVITRATERLRAAGADLPGSWLSPADLVAQAEQDIDTHTSAERVIPTGIPTLDRYLDGGLLPQRLYTLGARTSVGKSALATSITRHALDQGKRVLFCSLEMTGPEVLRRLTSEKFDLDHRDIANLVEAWGSEAVQSWPLNFVGLATIASLAATARLLRPQGLRLIVVDYIQLMPSTGIFERRDLEIGFMSRTLKLLAVELEVPVLMLSQLNRGTADDTPPQLYNLRESGNLEQDANVVMLLHRRHNDPSKRLEGELSVAKNRHGECGMISLRFRPERTQFRERFYEAGG